MAAISSAGINILPVNVRIIESSHGNFHAVMRLLLAQLRHKCVVSHLKDARYRLGHVRAARDGEVHRSIELGTTSKKKRAGAGAEC
jgi:hypothetical protein